MTKTPRSREKAAFGRSLPGLHARGMNDIGNWEPWFAWRPVRLYGEIRFAWLRPISKRFVLTGPKHLCTEYTDRPADFPAGQIAVTRTGKN